MNIVRELRRRADLQQQELATMVGVSRPTVSEWETQKKDPSGERLRKLAEIFDVDPLVVLGRGTPEISEEQSAAPRTLEARIVSFGMDQLPQEEREKILSILQTMYNRNPDIFKRGDDNGT